MVIGISGVALLLGPAVGVLTLLFTGAAFDLVNLIAALVYVAALPFAAIVTTYLYFDLGARQEAAAAEESDAEDRPRPPRPGRPPRCGGAAVIAARGARRGTPRCPRAASVAPGGSPG